MTVFLIIAGVGLIVLATVMGTRTERWFTRAKTADATVVRIEGEMPGQEYTGGRESAKIFPVVRFEDEAGATHEYRSRNSLPKKVISKGSRVEVMYAPGSPEDLRIGKGTDRSAYIMSAAVGVAFIVIAFFY